MWKEEGKRVSFFLKYFFFIVEWLRRGVRVYVNMLKGGGRGFRLNFFYKVIIGGRGGLIHFILVKII
jgi:hypothetical protein